MNRAVSADKTWLDRVLIPLIVYFLILGVAALLHWATNGYLDTYHTVAFCALWTGLKASWDGMK